MKPSGANYAGKTLTRQNFAHFNLQGANFIGATLKAASFLGADLTNANFQDATILDDPASPVLVTDFSMANLTGACFQGAKFSGTTYFTYSTLTCTDFSEADISTNAVFGESPLTFDRSANNCRPSFRSATMSCEFLADWQYFDLTKANIQTCLPEMAKFSFANAQMAGVNFGGADLDGVDFAGAVLTQATFTGASLQKVDLSYAKLQGASLNNANLTGANLYHAFLANDVEGKVDSSATAQQAHLKNVNLSFATLSGVNFTYANFYGTIPVGEKTCQTTQDNYQGFTKECASAHGAILTDTNFANAYLFGVDFTGGEMRGVNFTGAILAAANLAADLSTSTDSGSRTTLFRAYLQGANLGPAVISDPVSGFEAFVDFRTGGNIMYVYLSGANHNQFACKDACNPPSGADVCAETYYYPTGTTVPGNSSQLTCPDNSAGPCGAADPLGGNSHWRSPLLAKPFPAGLPPFWYAEAPTYPPTSPETLCKGVKPTRDW